MTILLAIATSILMIIAAIYTFTEIYRCQQTQTTFSLNQMKRFQNINLSPHGGIILLVLAVGSIFNLNFLYHVIETASIIIITLIGFNIAEKVIDKLIISGSQGWINLAYLAILFIFTMISISSVWAMLDSHKNAVIDHIVALATTLIPLLILSVFLSKNSKKTNLHSKKTKSKILHYRQSGLNDEEIKNFRQEMEILRDYIYTIDEEMNKAAKLRAIDLKYNTVNIAKQFFADIVKEPERLPEVANLLYRTAPSLADISRKYNEVNQHLAKTKQTYLILEKSAQTVEALAGQLENEYIQFHQATYHNLDDEIRFAQKNIDPQDTWDQFDKGE